MRAHTTKHPSGIPSAVKRDTILIKAMTTRRNLLERYAHCSRRVNPLNPKRSRIEKGRTKERKEIAEQLRALERDIMRWLGEHTKHPEIYTPSADERPLKNLTPALPRISPHDTLKIRQQKERMVIAAVRIASEDVADILCEYDQLKRRWYIAKRMHGSSNIGSITRNALHQQRTKTRHRIAVKLQDMEWKWMTALHERLFPDAPLPPRRIVKPSRFKP